MSNLVYIATSIDGYIATKDGGLDWLEQVPNPSKSDFGYEAFLERIEAIIMGRNTFEKIMTFSPWPYQKKVFVLSNQLRSIPKTMSAKAELIKGDLKDVVNKLRDRGFKTLYVDGGKTIQSFLKENLIDEIILSKVPIVLGNGVPLFGMQDFSIRFEHLSTQAFAGGLVQSHYKRIP